MEIKSPNTPSEFPGISSATVKKLDTCLSMDKASLWGLHHAKRSSSHSASDGSQTERQDQSEDTNRSEVSRKLETDHSNQMATEVNHQDTDDWKKLGEFSQDSREKIENKSNEDTSESNQPCDVNQDRPSFDLNRTMHTRKPAYAAEIERQRYQAEMEKKRNEAEARADRSQTERQDQSEDTNRSEVSRKLETDHSNQMATEVNHQDTDDWKKLGEFNQDRREEIQSKSNQDASESNQPSDVNEDRPNTQRIGWESNRETRPE
ncbi:uncharacterized protein DDB_G0290685 [Diaphorina citri]|uniref:Uncharacterized protein DDB_G0290685 n=1 Tax=Diaphorina citri TaxID=121845 RepID=A0A1S3CTB7_DIACI|nr:uncharacterized protein DDB_G0290685 [Diaphorina citri]